MPEVFMQPFGAVCLLTFGAAAAALWGRVGTLLEMRCSSSKQLAFTSEKI